MPTVKAATTTYDGPMSRLIRSVAGARPAAIRTNEHALTDHRRDNMGDRHQHDAAQVADCLASRNKSDQAEPYPGQDIAVVHESRKHHRTDRMVRQVDQVGAGPAEPRPPNGR